MFGSTLILGVFVVLYEVYAFKSLLMFWSVIYHSSVHRLHVPYIKCLGLLVECVGFTDVN